MSGPGLRLGTGVYDPARRLILGPDGEQSLSPIEARLLEHLADHAGQILSVESLLREVWAYAPGVITRTHYATVERLRKKIELDPSNPRQLFTHPGLGYRFERLSRIPPEDLIGRDALFQEVLDALGPGVALLLTGPGGVGKTRLAAEIAGAAEAEGWPVRRCALAAAREQDAALPMLAGALEVQLSGGDPVDQLGHALASLGRALLVLDNLEQIELGPALARWRAAAPSLCWLLTSRARAGLAGARIIEVPPLDLPVAGEDPARAPALRLLLRRGAVLVPGLRPSPALARIASAVGGLALGLELAAARLRLLSPEALADRLERDLGALGDASREARHASLSALVAWSVALLPPQQRAALEAMAVFPAPFDAALAEAVLGPGALDAIEALHAQHLIRVEPGPALDLYQPVRAWLLESCPPGPTLKARYAAAVLAAAPSGEVLDGPDAPTRWVALVRLLPHLLAAARAREVGADAARAALLASQVLMRQGPVQQALAPLAGFEDVGLEPWLQAEIGLAAVKAAMSLERRDEAAARLRALAPADPAQRLRAGMLACRLQWRRGDWQGAGAAARALEPLAVEVGDPLLQVELLLDRGWIAISGADLVEARRALEAARLCVPEGVGLASRVAIGAGLGRLLLLQRELESARAVFRETLGLAEALGLSLGSCAALEALGYVHAELGEIDEARAHLSRALAEVERQGNLQLTWLALRSLGWFELGQGRLEPARAHLRRAAQGAGAAGDRAREAMALWRLAELERRAGDLQGAEVFLDRADPLWPAGAFPIERARAGVVRGWLRLARGELDAARAAVAAADQALGARPPGWEPELARERAALAARL